LPLTIPAFVQYQAPLVPLRGLWRRPPVEGDYFVTVEVDWLVSPPGNAVQFSLSGNSPVALSQIVALAIDNGRSGADVDFIFADSGFVLSVPARSQLVAPVFTNALMFYATAPNAVPGDVTVAQVLNSMPPPVQAAPTSAQNHASATAIALATAATTPLIAAPVSGTLNSFSIQLSIGTAGAVQIALVDGAARTLWVDQIPAAPVGLTTINLSGLSTRFSNGLNFVVSAPGGGIAGTATVNLYYSTP
jgi:hypothetical protein